jgi:hypothetical protein
VRGAFECPPGATIVDLPSEQATPEDFVRLIEAVVLEAAGRITVAGPASPTNIPFRPRDISRVFADWKATSLAQGVRETVEFYRVESASA